MTTPFVPDIAVTASPAGAAAECKCCGDAGAGADVRHVNLRWRDRASPQSGGQAVALCRSCREETMAALAGSL